MSGELLRRQDRLLYVADVPTFTRVSSFAMLLALPSTRSRADRSVEHGGRRAAVEAVPAIGPLVVVELQEAIERALQRAAAREIRQ